MGRRSTHTSLELRAIIIEAAQKIVEEHGLGGLSAREIAREIGYSPGTLYNLFDNLDAILLTLQVDILGRAIATLEAVETLASPQTQIQKLAETYVGFAIENRLMWNLLFTHVPTNIESTPSELHDQLNELASIVTRRIAPLMNGASDDQVSLAARSLWSGVHGITAIAVTDKAPTLTAQTAQDYAQCLVQNFLNGLNPTS